MPVDPLPDVPEVPPFGAGVGVVTGGVEGAVADPGRLGGVDVPGVVVVPGVGDVPGAGVVPLVPVEPRVVDSGCPAPLTGGVVAAPGPVPGAQGAITSAFGAPFEPIVPAVPVVPAAPVAGIELVTPLAAPVAALVVPVAPLVAGVFRLPVVDPFVALDGTIPLVPVAPVSGTHGIVAGGGAAGDTPAGDVVCGEADGVCAIAAALESPSAAAAA